MRLLIVLSAIGAAGSASAAPPFRLIIANGQTVPTLSGPSLTLTSFGGSSTGRYAQLTDDGTLALVGTAQTKRGVWSVRSDGTIVPFAVSGDGVPGSGGALTYGGAASFLFEPWVAGTDLVAYAVPVIGVGPNNSNAVIIGRPGPGQKWAAPFDPAPGLPGVTFQVFSPPRPTVGGGVMVSASLQGSGVTTANDRAVYQYTDTDARLLMREGDQAVGEAAGVYYNNVSGQAVSRGTQLLFDGNVAGAGITDSSNSRRVWRTTDSGLETVWAQRRTLVPGFNDGTVWTTGLPRFSREGEHAILSSQMSGPTITSSNNEGLWSWQGGTWQSIIREGETFVGPAGVRTVRSTQSTGYSINENGQWVSGVSTLDSVGGTHSDLLIGDSSGLRVLHELGQQAPGLPVGVLIGSTQLSPINEVGQFALAITLTGSGVSTANDLALYVGNVDGSMHLVVRRGDLFEYSPGNFAPITTLTGDFGLSFTGVPINNSGTMWFYASFNNGFQGLYATTVPTPGVLALPVLAAVITSRRRR